jgi:predicted ATPase
MLMTGDLDAAEKAVRTLKDIATRHNATWWKTLGDCLEAKLLIERGEFAAGVSLFRSAVKICDQTGWTVCYPEFLGALAEGLAGLGQVSEALVTVDGALAQANDGGERWYVPELLRIKAKLLIQAQGDCRSLSKAEHCLRIGLDAARNQGALFWELRCALSLARLKQNQNAPPVYDRFSEGLHSRSNIFFVKIVPYPASWLT